MSASEPVSAARRQQIQECIDRLHIGYERLDHDPNWANGYENAIETLEMLRDAPPASSGAPAETAYATRDATPMDVLLEWKGKSKLPTVGSIYYECARQMEEALQRERDAAPVHAPAEPPTQRDRQQLIDHVGSHVEGETEGAANCETCEYIRNELRQRLVSEPPPARTPDSKEQP